MLAATMPIDSTPPASHDPDAAAGGRLVSADGRELPLRGAHLEVEARGGIARAVLTQRFYNPDAAPLSVRYLLPLPAEAAVAGFAFTLGDTRVVGEVQPRQTARETFERAIASGRTAALVEEARSTLFTQRVGNIPPGAEVVCEITLDQKLRWLADGAWEWRFPTVVGPRYPGAPGRVADAAALSVPVSTAALPARAGLDLAIGDALTGAVTSPSHAVSAEADDGATRVRVAESARLDRDVVVRWPVAAPAVGVAVSAARPADPGHGGRTYGLLSVVPPGAPMAPRARDLVLLVDTSGSMGGQPLDQAKRVLAALVERLGERDRVEMISFGSRPERFRPEPIAATADGRKAALKWLRTLSASGGTEMHTALLEALRPLRPDAQRQIVLVTDGYIGFEQEIIARLLTDLPPDSRLHTIGVGSAPNRTLTEGAARAGRGAELIIGLGEDADAAAARLVARIGDPLVTELTIEGPGLAELAPMRLPDLYAGAPALLGVACHAPGPLTLRGRTADGPFAQTVEVPALALGEGAQGVAALYGRNRVDDLELRISAGEPSGALDGEIERVGVRFGIATRRTSWVAVSDAVTVDPTAARREVEQPHEVPYGASIEGFGLRAAAPAFGGMAPPPPAMRPPAPSQSRERTRAGGFGGSAGADKRAKAEAPLREVAFDGEVAESTGAGAPPTLSRAEPAALQSPPPPQSPEPAPGLPPVRAQAEAPVSRRPSRWVFVIIALILALVAALAWLFGGGAPVEAPVERPAEGTPGD